MQIEIITNEQPLNTDEIAWEYDDCNGMSDTYEATHNGVLLLVTSFSDATYWHASKDGTLVEGKTDKPDDIEAAKRCAITAGNALLTMFASLTNLQGGHMTQVGEP